MMTNLYREEILEHYKEPHNFGEPATFDVTSQQHNPFCGDDIALYVSYKNDIIKNISFIGKGCAISIASVSMLTDYVCGKTKNKLTKMSEEDMLQLLGLKVSDTRKKCALLGFAVLQDCIR